MASSSPDCTEPLLEALQPSTLLQQHQEQPVLHGSGSVSLFCFYYCILRAHSRLTNNLARKFYTLCQGLTSSLFVLPQCPPLPQCHKCPWKAGDLSVHAPRSLLKECEETVGKCVQQRG